MTMEMNSVSQLLRGTVHSFTERLLRLDHPNTVRYDSFYEDGKHVYAVLKLLQGPDLFDYLLEVDISLSSAVAFARQLLDATAHFHALGLTHRDIKCENIKLVLARPGSCDGGEFVTPDGTIRPGSLKVFDFGVGALDLGIERMHTLAPVGSLGYTAPEVLDGHYNAKCDIWSVGVVVYILFTGGFPYQCDTESDFRAALRRERLPSDGHLYGKLRASMDMGFSLFPVGFAALQGAFSCCLRVPKSPSTVAELFAAAGSLVCCFWRLSLRTVTVALATMWAAIVARSSSPAHVLQETPFSEPVWASCESARSATQRLLTIDVAERPSARLARGIWRAIDVRPKPFDPQGRTVHVSRAASAVELSKRKVTESRTAYVPRAVSARELCKRETTFREEGAANSIQRCLSSAEVRETH